MPAVISSDDGGSSSIVSNHGARGQSLAAGSTNGTPPSGFVTVCSQSSAPVASELSPAPTSCRISSAWVTHAGWLVGRAQVRLEVADPTVVVAIGGERAEHVVGRAVTFEEGEAAAVDQASVGGDELGGGSDIGHATSVPDAAPRGLNETDFRPRAPRPRRRAA